MFADGASSHTSSVAQNHLEKATPELINKDEWPSQNPDCNPIDHDQMGLFEGEVYRGVQDKLTTQALMNKIKMSWKKILIKEIRKGLFAWKKRLHLVVEEDGGHIEHRLK